MQPTGWTQIWVGIGLTVVSVALPFLVPGQWTRVAGVVGLVLGVLIILIVLFFHLVEQRVQARLNETSGRNVSQVAPSFARESEFLGMEGFEFYDSRDKLSQKRPLSSQLESARVILALWNTGGRAYTEDAHRTGKIRQLLLPTPYGPGVTQMANALLKPVDSIKGGILALTQEAEAAGVKVRWLDDLPSNTMMFGDPDEDSAWLTVELLQPGVPAQDRPSFRIEKRHHPRLYRAYREAFTALWDRATTKTVESFSDQLRRSQRRAESFPLVLPGGSVREYTHGEIERLPDSEKLKIKKDHPGLWCWYLGDPDAGPDR